MLLNLEVHVFLGIFFPYYNCQLYFSVKVHVCVGAVCICGTGS